MSSFVKVRAEREQPFRALEMVIPRESFERDLAVFAAQVPRDYVWTAKFVPDISLRSEGVLVPDTGNENAR